jgi:fructose-1,6-bisphosphatase/inositol monophosphatase family enzyme
MLPGSRMIGEEMCHERPELLDGIAAAEEPLWIVDPLDGTGNFVKGDRHFAIMVALVVHNETVAGWMLRPADGSLAWAERGSGAFLDRARVRAPTTVPPTERLRGAVLTRFLSPEMKQRIERNSAQLGEVFPGSLCAGFDYPDLAAGAMDFVQYWRGLPWDHAPGALYLTEAGGAHTRFDGSPWRPGERRTGLLAAANAGIALAVRQALELG